MYWVRICSAGRRGRRAVALVSHRSVPRARFGIARGSSTFPRAPQRGAAAARPRSAAAGSSPSGPAAAAAAVLDDLVVGVDRSRAGRGAGRGPERRSVAARTVIRAAPQRISAPGPPGPAASSPSASVKKPGIEQQHAGDAGSAPPCAIGPTGSPPASSARAQPRRAPAGPGAASARSPTTAASSTRPSVGQSPISPPTSMNSAISTIGSARKIKQKPHFASAAAAPSGPLQWTWRAPSPYIRACTSGRHRPDAKSRKVGRWARR